MPPTVLSTTLQSTALKIIANLVAQLAAQKGRDGPLSIDVHRVAVFAIFGLIVSPMNFLWQQFLERSFPTYYVEQRRPNEAKLKDENDKTVEKRKELVQQSDSKPAPVGPIKWSNVLVKWLLDQTLGQVVINSTFIIVTKWSDSESVYMLFNYIQLNILTILRASWKLWPIVALLNFIFVPVAWRVLVSSIIGFGWNIFLTFLSARM